MELNVAQKSMLLNALKNYINDLCKCEDDETECPIDEILKNAEELIKIIQA